MGHLNERLERVMGSVKVEAKKPYVPQSREARQAVEADMHEDVAKAARDVLHAVEAMTKVVLKAVPETETGTFSETLGKLRGADIGSFMIRIATDHTRWAKNIRAAHKGE
jgi:hypothetical protein